MSVHLLDKTRKINSLLRNNNENRVDFNDICLLLSESVMSGVVIISNKGKILGQNNDYVNEIKVEELQGNVGTHVGKDFNRRLMGVLSTNENANLSLMGLDSNQVAKLKSMIIPVYMSGKRLGTMIMYRSRKTYSIEDIITSEHASTVIALEMTHAIAEEDGEEQRKRQCITDCVEALTELEKRAAEILLSEVVCGGEYVVTTKIADKVGITRSVFANVLKKMESAGIVQSKSAGTKGTRVTIKNEYFLETLKNN